MKKTSFDESPNNEDELLPEYQFDYRKAKPNRFAAGIEEAMDRTTILTFITSFCELLFDTE